MSIDALAFEVRDLAKSLKAKARFSSQGFFHDPVCPFEVKGIGAGIKFRILIGNDGGLVTFKNFVLHCPFDLSFWKPQPLLNLIVNISSELQSSIPMFSNPGNPDVNCIRSILHSWPNWPEFARKLQVMEKPVLLSQKMSQIFFTRVEIVRLKELVPALISTFSSPPFILLKTSITSRLADNPNIKLDEKRIPPNLKTLLPLAAEWSIMEESEVYQYSRKVGSEKTKAFLQAFERHLGEIEACCFPSPLPVPVRDELLVFQIASKAFSILRTLP